jgi:hypothetical protein
MRMGNVLRKIEKPKETKVSYENDDIHSNVCKAIFN